MKKIILCIMFIFLVSCSKAPFSYDTSKINVIKDIDEKAFDFETHSSHYLLADMSEYEILYRSNTSDVIYPASITKLFVLDTVLNKLDRLDGVSSINYDEFLWLIAEDSSLAGLYVDHEYTIEDLLYALVLPSGGDAAIALGDYFENRGEDLVELMNARCEELNLKSSHFTNTTGLHDDNLYTCIDDIYTVVMDILTFEKGREIIGSLSHNIDERTTVYSTVGYVGKSGVVNVLGGKTGYTPESGQSIVVLYRKNYHSYLLVLTNAMGGGPATKEYFHYEDCFTIFDHLYYN